MVVSHSQLRLMLPSDVLHVGQLTVYADLDSITVVKESVREPDVSHLCHACLRMALLGVETNQPSPLCAPCRKRKAEDPTLGGLILRGRRNTYTSSVSLLMS
jgi:hypothetical protein